MSEKYAGRFVPYRKPRGPRSEAAIETEKELERVTRDVAKRLEEVALAMDVLPARGSIAFRDEWSRVWVVTIQLSDVPTLRCEEPES